MAYIDKFIQDMKSNYQVQQLVVNNNQIRDDALEELKKVYRRAKTTNRYQRKPRAGQA